MGERGDETFDRILGCLIEANRAWARHAAALQDEIAAALCRCRWFSVVAPSQARYHLRGNVRGDGGGRLRVAIALLEASTDRYLFADRWDGAVADIDRSGNPYVDQFIHGRAVGPIQMQVKA